MDGRRAATPGMGSSADPRRVGRPGGCCLGSRSVSEVGRLRRVHEMVRPEAVLGFHGLCLVKPADDDWDMGSLYDDGSMRLVGSL